MNNQLSNIALVENASYIPLICREFSQAAKTIDLAMYLYVLDVQVDAHSSTRRITRELADAVQRGVNVRALLAKPASKRLAHKNRVSASFLKSKGIEVRMTKDHLLHTKMVIIDDGFSILGSHNITSRALEVNHELSIALWDKQSARTLSDHFSALWSTSN